MALSPEDLVALARSAPATPEGDVQSVKRVMRARVVAARANVVRAQAHLDRLEMDLARLNYENPDPALPAHS